MSERLISTNADALAAAARRLADAARSGNACPPVRDLIGPDDVHAAYAVQQLLSRDRVAAGARIVGRKIGLTSQAVQQQLGVDRPDFGVLFDDMQYPSGSTLPTSRLIQPRVEAEVAFVLGEDLAAGELGPDQVRAAVAHAVAALEVVDSRIEGWDITFTDTVADNGSSGLFVIGDAQVGLAEFVPADCSMSMYLDGVEVSAGAGRACLGDPLEALRWLAETSREFGQPLSAGDVVLSGALGPMAPVRPGSAVRAEISGLGSVTCDFA
jgi:2-keto-4-pentenoate hydratase